MLTRIYITDSLYGDHVAALDGLFGFEFSAATDFYDGVSPFAYNMKIRLSLILGPYIRLFSDCHYGAFIRRATASFPRHGSQLRAWRASC